MNYNNWITSSKKRK